MTSVHPPYVLIIAQQIFKINHFTKFTKGVSQCEISWFPLNELPQDILPRPQRIIEAIKKDIFYADEGFE